ncbi:hypothetical protein AK812_SmicGene23513 [Symbiodinium microadriaticum]|uniref:RNase H type-1 domain-containing protein n=1 Tax=Symbiodinium microadriaticum TaxID=2951 RepID=A0A1Q9DH43_SYMMI|nr:hypothetical protein AK812_SmicGene23513 [Symbiodinium microadriaticum]
MAPWQCSCGNNNKASASFCAACGTKWDNVTYSAGWTAQGKGFGWETQGWQSAPSSPRRRAEPWRAKSPRKRTPAKGQKGKDSGKDPGKTKGKGNGGAPDSGKGPSTPSLQLPTPPSRPTVAAPAGTSREPAAGPSASSADRQALEKLLQAMKANEQELTPQLRELLEQHKHEDTKEEARNLHKLVTSKASAKKELTKVRTARTNYLQAWSSYLDQVISTLQTQMEEHANTMSDFLLKEGQWDQALQESTAALAKLAAESSAIETITDDDEDAMEANDIKVDEACQAELQAQKLEEKAQALKQQGHDITQALKAAKAQATEEQLKDQARERTPRRAKPNDDAGKKADVDSPAMRAVTHLHSVCGEWDFATPQAARWFAVQLQYELVFYELGMPFTPGRDARVEFADTLVFWEAPASDTSAEAVGNCLTASGSLAFQPSSSQHGHRGSDVADEARDPPKYGKDPQPGPGLGLPMRPVGREDACTDLGWMYSAPVFRAPSTSQPVTSVVHSSLASGELSTMPPRPVLPAPIWSLARDRTFPMMRLHLASRIPFFPSDLDRPEQRQRVISSFAWITGFRATGAVQGSEGQFDRFVIYDSAVHVQTRPLPRGWDLNHVVAELLGIFPRLRSVRFLWHKLPNLPSLQVAVTMRDMPPGQEVLPLDFRHQEGRICTVRVSPGMSAEAVYHVCIRDCPHFRLPRTRFALQDCYGEPLRIPHEVDAFPDFGRGVSADYQPMQPPAAPDAQDQALPPAHAENVAGDAILEEAADDPEDDSATLVQTHWHVRPAACTAILPSIRKQPGQQNSTPCADGIQPVVDFEARSQRVPSHGTCTANVLPLRLPPSPRRPAHDSDPPSLLKRRLSGDHSKPAVEQWQLHPPALREPRYSGAVVPHMTWGRRLDATTHLFTVFDTQRHLSAIPGNDAAKVEDFARQAIDTAPGPVRAIQFLTAPIPGLPLPQLVLTLASDPVDTLAIPWDCRAACLPIRTVPHLPNERLQHASEKLQHTTPTEPDLAERINNGRLLVFDVAGLIQDVLPEDLTEMQWLRVERPIWDEAFLATHLRLPDLFASLRLGPPAGLVASVSTTSTTTGMMSDSIQTYRIRLFGDGKEVSHDVQAPCPQLDLILCLLLGKLQHLAPPSYEPAYIMLAKAQPPPVGDTQEVLFLSHPNAAFDTIPVFVDGRPQGGTLVLTALHRLTTTEHAVPDNLRNAGCFALVNGAPAHLAQRSVMPGDFVQLGCSGVYVPHTATAAIMDRLTSTDVYGYAFVAQRGTGDGSFLQRIRERRRAAQVWQPLENLITIVGPAHGPVRLRLETLFVPTVEEVRVALIPMVDFNGMRLAMAHTTAQIPGAALFVTVCPQSDLRTVLLPLATSPTHHIVLMIPSLAADLGYLPLDPQQRILWTFGRWRHGQILAIFTLPASMARPVHRHVRPPRPALRETYSPGGRVVPRSGTSLVQLPSFSSRMHDRCRKAARQWEVDEQQPCVDDLPQEVHDRLNAIPVQVGDGEDVAAACAKPALSDATADRKCGARFTVPTPCGRRPIPTGHPVPARAPIPAPRAPHVTAVDSGLPPFSRFPTETGCNTLTVQGPDSPADEDRPCSIPEMSATPRCRTLCLADLVPNPAPAVTWGVNDDIREACLAGHSMEHLYGPEVHAELDPTAAIAWNLLPELPAGFHCDELFIFTDGSYFIDATFSTWALVAIVRSGGVVYRAGFWAGVTHDLHEHTYQPCAYDGELEALLHALGLAAATPCMVCHIGADCESAVAVATGSCPTAPTERTARAAVGLNALTAAQGKTIHFHKVEAHSGCGFNDLADQLAKRVGRKGVRSSSTGPWEDFWQGISETVVDRLWLTAKHPNLSTCLPPLCEDGTWTRPNCHVRNSVAIDRFFSMAEAATAVRPITIALKIMQYNPLSLRPTGASALLARGLRAQGIHIAGFQETRLQQNGMVTMEGFWVFSSACTKAGVGGAQIWIRQDPAWQRQAFSIVHAEPQILLVLGVYKGQQVTVLSAHAPQTTKPIEELETWWQHLRTVLHRAPATCLPICCIDANATFVHDADQGTSVPKCANARLLQALLAAKASCFASRAAKPVPTILYMGLLHMDGEVVICSACTAIFGSSVSFELQGPVVTRLTNTVQNPREVLYSEYTYTSYDAKQGRGHFLDFAVADAETDGVRTRISMVKIRKYHHVLSTQCLLPLGHVDQAFKKAMINARLGEVKLFRAYIHLSIASFDLRIVAD